MGYAKKWVPPTAPVPNSLTAWKDLFLDLHQNLLDAGLVQTATAGQLNLSTVAALPARNTFAGFIEYALTDDLQSTAPITFRLEFGSGVEGLHTAVLGPDDRDVRRDMAPIIRATVKFGAASSAAFGYPQTLINTASNYSNTAPVSAAGFSAICNSPERGFLGVAYGVGSRNKPFATVGSTTATAGSYYGSTFSLFIQRTVDGSGVPTSDGVALYYTGLNVAQNTLNLWTAGKLNAAYSEFLPPHAYSVARTYAGRLDVPVVLKSANNDLLLEQIYYSSPALKPHPYLYSVHMNALTEQSQFAIEVAPGEPLNFLCLGRETSISVDVLDAQNAALVMLFDES